MKNFPNVSVVVIGYNEADNLVRTFTAIRNMNYPSELIELIYVDSGSIDGSIDIAKNFTSRIFIEDKWPTAARNRNRGLFESTFDIVHFVDGDVNLHPDYLQEAVFRILGNEAHCVFGNVKELTDNIWDSILIHDYQNRIPGYVDSPGAGGTFLKKSLNEISGWDERIPRGEEIEFGIRFREAGYKILFVNSIMGYHDYGVKNILDFFRKQINEGKSMGAIFQIRSKNEFTRQSSLNVYKNIIFHMFSLFFFLYSILYNVPEFFISFIFLYLLFILFKYLYFRKVRNINTLVYYMLMNLTRTLTLTGTIIFTLDYYRKPVTEISFFHNRMKP